MKVLISALIVFLLSVIPTEAARRVAEVKYGDHERNRMIISMPEEGKGNAVVVWFHGGGLTGGEPYIPEELLDTDYIIVAPAYRLLPDVDIDACIEDAADAVASVFGNIENFGGDKEKIFVAGHSAGGYLASMIGLDKSRLAKRGIDANAIAGLFPVSGQAITHYEWRKMTGGSDLQPTIDQYAPIYHIRKDASPYIIICGDRELELLGRYEENAYMWRMMKLIGHPDVSIYEIGGHNHGDMVGPAMHIVKNHIKRLLDTKKAAW